MNSAIKTGNAIQSFSDNSFRFNTSGTTIVSHLRSTKFCLISSAFFSSFFTLLILFDLVKEPSSSIYQTLHLVFLPENGEFLCLF